MPRIRLSVVIVTEEDGVSAYCPELPGCMTQAATMDEAKRNIVEAIRLNLDHLASTGQPLPTLPVEQSPLENGLFLPVLSGSNPLASKFAALDQKMAGNAQRFDLILA